MKSQSEVEFPGNARVHIGLVVQDLERSKEFYQVLFGEEPSKERPGYAKFEPQDPSVNLSLNQATTESGTVHLVTHYGVQVKSTQQVEDAIERFQQAGLETKVETQSTCCYALQDKVWVADPDGNRWEVFVVLNNDAPQYQDEHSQCCATESTQAQSCCSPVATSLAQSAST